MNKRPRRTPSNSENSIGYHAGRRRDTALFHNFTAEQARKRALELRASVWLGGDPARERDKRRGVLTFAAFMAERFIPHVRETVRSHAEYETMARLRLTPRSAGCAWMR